MAQKNLRHVAIVMDGNGRWATKQGLSRIEGHRQGVLVVKKIIESCVKNKISYLSLFTFSHENWSRPKEEVNFLMELFMASLNQELEMLCAQGIRLRFLGSRDGLTPQLVQEINQAEEKTKPNDVLNLNLALNYTGKWDILNATKKCLEQGLSSTHLDSAKFESYLSTHGLPDPDLMIRTSGEQRISNFFLWQLAYTELYFTDTLWPDFNAQAFEEALNYYFSRERRFGKTSQQLREDNNV